MTAAWARHLAEHPVAEGERVLFMRRWLDREAGDLPCPSQAACWLDVKRTYMELRSSLRRLYTVSSELEAYADSLGALRFQVLPEAEVRLGAATYHTAMLDFGHDSVVGWLARLAEVDDVADDDHVPEPAIPDGTVTIMFTDIAGSTALTEELGDAAFRSVARRLETSLRACVGETGGAVIEGKLLGDGLLAVFTSAGPALECAVRCVERRQRRRPRPARRPPRGRRDPGGGRHLRRRRRTSPRGWPPRPPRARCSCRRRSGVSPSRRRASASPIRDPAP